VAQPAEARPAAQSFPAVHDHRFGNCKGVLTITGQGIAYVPEKGTHGFEFGWADCTWAVEKDQLTVRSRGKTWRFKSPAAGDLFKALSKVGSQKPEARTQ